MQFAKYKNSFRNIVLERDEESGILDLRLHTDGGALKWGIDPGAVHEQLGEALYKIGRDPENKVMILRGTGDVFCTQRNIAEYRHIDGAEPMYRLMREGRDLLINTLELEIPIISVVHGAATIHPEVPAMADMVLASPEACFQDSHIPIGIAPGDGAQIFWTAVLGPTRASYFFLSEEVLSAQEALRLGVVHEILPRESLLTRARELANRLASKPILTLRATRMAVNQALKERIAKEAALGFVSETLAQAAAEGHPLVDDVERERSVRDKG